MKTILLTNASQMDDIARDEMSAAGGVNQQQQQLQQQQMLQNLEFKQGMLLEREQRVQKIEAVVLDVNEIMRDLNTLINQQSENIGKFQLIFTSSMKMKNKRLKMQSQYLR